VNPVHIILALSVLANAALGWAYLGQRDKAAKASDDLTHMQQQRDGARGAASACSDAVEALQEQAAQRAAAAAPVRAVAAKAAQQSDRREGYEAPLARCADSVAAPNSTLAQAGDGGA
jgi:hypothetical protein